MIILKQRPVFTYRYLKHEGVNGMKWGYTNGKKNGGRVAGEKDEDDVNKKSTNKSDNKDDKSLTKDEVSGVVNKIIRGDFGNGADRVKALTDAGYDYKTMQGYVNDVLAGKDIDMSKMGKSDTTKTNKTTNKTTKKTTKKTTTSKSSTKKSKSEKINDAKKKIDELLKQLDELEKDD